MRSVFTDNTAPETSIKKLMDLLGTSKAAQIDTARPAGGATGSSKAASAPFSTAEETLRVVEVRNRLGSGKLNPSLNSSLEPLQGEESQPEHVQETDPELKYVLIPNMASDASIKDLRKDLKALIGELSMKAFITFPNSETQSRNGL
jgi:hypothetical protein